MILTKSSFNSPAYKADSTAPHAGSTRIRWSLAKLMHACRAVRSSTTLERTGCTWESSKSFSQMANAPRLLAMLQKRQERNKQH